ncbi:translation initiation factor IF-2-like [Elephas maximus indicus]|uniref:translation initiation factor IF-2-like n=1 Tax=Elephas maximus indicus TaxID=99487 RepID=UPI0021167AB8|nr:translation initiation factor IF-2-like [Elephas maximus indicus]
MAAAASRGPTPASGLLRGRGKLRPVRRLSARPTPSGEPAAMPRNLQDDQPSRVGVGPQGPFPKPGDRPFRTLSPTRQRGKLRPGGEGPRGAPDRGRPGFPAPRGGGCRRRWDPAWGRGGRNRGQREQGDRVAETPIPGASTLDLPGGGGPPGSRSPARPRLPQRLGAWPMGGGGGGGGGGSSGSGLARPGGAERRGFMNGARAAHRARERQEGRARDRVGGAPGPVDPAQGRSRPLGPGRPPPPHSATESGSLGAGHRLPFPSGGGGGRSLHSWRPLPTRSRRSRLPGWGCASLPFTPTASPTQGSRVTAWVSRGTRLPRLGGPWSAQLRGSGVHSPVAWGEQSGMCDSPRPKDTEMQHNLGILGRTTPAWGSPG